ncbi:tail fiber domain-containing protein, partial [Nostoc sp. NIES-2111]
RQRPVATRRPAPIQDPFDEAQGAPEAPVVYLPTVGVGGGGGWSSDRRLKRHIAKLGQSPDGHTIYSFQYVWGGPFYVGVMAQEIAPVVPEAILYDAEGFLMVDYDRIDVTPMLLEDWLRGRVRYAA